MNKEEDKTIPERAVNLMGDIARHNIRAVNGDKSDKDLGIDENFFQESVFYFYRGEIKRFKNWLGKLFKK